MTSPAAVNLSRSRTLRRQCATNSSGLNQLLTCFSAEGQCSVAGQSVLVFFSPAPLTGWQENSVLVENEAPCEALYTHAHVHVCVDFGSNDIDRPGGLSKSVLCLHLCVCSYMPALCKKTSVLKFSWCSFPCFRNFIEVRNSINSKRINRIKP